MKSMIWINGRVAAAGLWLLLVTCASCSRTDSSAINETGPGAETDTAVVDAGDRVEAVARSDSSTEAAGTGSAAALKGQPKQARQPIYNENADARADIAAAVERARGENKRVLVKFGGNWCGWCFKLHDLFHENREIASLLRNEYELVLVDVNKNREIIEAYAPDENYGFPWLTVLDSQGKVLCNQETGALEIGPRHDPAKVQAFLKEWQAEPIAANQALTSGLQRAKAENKRVLLHVGAPWCGWCHVLERFLRANSEVLGADYVDLKIDQDRMAGGRELAVELRAGHPEQGIPWMAILDADGKTLVTSDGPRGNIGHPSEDHEIEHFIHMLQQTRKQLTDEQIAGLERQLRADAAQRKAR
ncbi:MAG: thioredoxin family protein [Planctomycetes bacterium]|nr:thioredoxin family protein [Planctomycetota bacterium]